MKIEEDAAPQHKTILKLREEIRELRQENYELRAAVRRADMTSRRIEKRILELSQQRPSPPRVDELQGEDVD